MLPKSARIVSVLGLWALTVRNLIAIVLVFGIYRVLQDRFEIIAVSVLIVIFAFVARDDRMLHRMESLFAYLSMSPQSQDPEAQTHRLWFGSVERKDLLENIDVLNIVATWVVELTALWHLVKAIGWV